MIPKPSLKVWSGMRGAFMKDRPLRQFQPGKWIWKQEVLQSVSCPRSTLGRIAVLGSRVYQLTWRRRPVLSMTWKALLLRVLFLPYGGLGLTTTGST